MRGSHDIDVLEGFTPRVINFANVLFIQKSVILPKFVNQIHRVQQSIHSELSKCRDIDLRQNSQLVHNVTLNQYKLEREGIIPILMAQN